MDANDDFEVRGAQPTLEPPKAAPEVELEATDSYLRRVVADIRRSRARTADRVAMTLVIAVVGSLPLYVLAVALVGGIDKDDLTRIFGKWYDVVSPLLGAAIGALFGIAIANPNREQDRL